MRPLRRGHVNKGRSASKFRRHSRRTNGLNMKGLARGGWRL